MSADNTAGVFLRVIKERQIMNFCRNNNLQYIEPDKIGRADLERKYEEYTKKNYQGYEARMKKEQEEQAEREKELQEKRKQERIADFVGLIPTRYKTASTDDFKSLDIIPQILDGKRAIILGDNDTGKTRLAWALGKSWVEQGESVNYYDAQILLYTIKTQDNPYQYIEQHLNQSLQHLIIDEVDKVYNSTADFIYFNQVIKTRYEWNLQTILIGNGDKNTFIQSGFGQTVFSKMTRDGGIYLPLKKEVQNGKLRKM